MRSRICQRQVVEFSRSVSAPESALSRSKTVRGTFGVWWLCVGGSIPPSAASASEGRREAPRTVCQARRAEDRTGVLTVSRRTSAEGRSMTSRT